MKRFGDFRPLDSVISSDSLLDLHVAVNSVDDLNSYPNNTIAVFTQNSGEYRSGDVVINKGDGKGWVTLKSSFSKLGPVTKLRGYCLSKRVYLKWKDPVDVYNNSGDLKCAWHHSIVMRKYGSAPQNELDGTVVRVVYERDKYGAAGYNYLMDYIPDADKQSKWYYRVFAVADNGTIDYSNSAAAVTLNDMPWSEIVAVIKDGRASEILSVGDSWRFDDGNEMMVADISSKRVTMLLKYSRYNIPFDASKGEYFLTKDERVSRLKTYYNSSGTISSYINGTYIAGKAIDGTIYEKNLTNTNRSANGSNRWSSSDIRFWMNNIHLFGDAADIVIRPCIYKYLELIHGMVSGTLQSHIEEYKNLLKVVPSLSESDFHNVGPVPPYFYLKRYCPEILPIIVSTTNSTHTAPCDGNVTDTTEDYFFIPSITEITGASNGGSREGSRYGVFAEKVADGKFYSIGINGTDTTYDQIDAFTRSVNTLSASSGYELLSTDGTSKLFANAYKGVIIAFNIGK